MSKELFSLYYINLEKVYELRMIRNNFIQEKRILENNVEKRGHDSVDAGLSSGIKGIISSSIGVKSSIDSLKSVKVSDSFTVKQTKSNILSDILEITNKKDDLLDAKDGELVRLDGLRLELENEKLVRIFKILSRDIIKGQANGIDINKALNALAKDYSYLLSTTISGKDVVMKIPMSGEGEFENKYSIDDLLIGNVGIIGVYKGIIQGSEINSTFDFFSNLGNAMEIQSTNEDEIQSSSNEKLIQQYELTTTLKEKVDYAFIDLLAVVQQVKVKELEENNNTMSKSSCFFKRIFRSKK